MSIETVETGGKKGPDISFAGCGFIGIYHVGVSASLSRYAPHLLQQRILGSSAGALAGAALIGEVPLQLMAKNVLEVASLASMSLLGPFRPSFDLASVLWDGLEKMLPDDIHVRCTDRLYVSMTKISERSNLLVHHFQSRRELLEALRASSFVPLLSGWRPPRFKGDLVFDGGYSDNLPVFDERTITVSPFAGDASICPPDDTQIGALLNLKIPHGPTNSSNSFHFSRDNSRKLINAVVPPNTEGMEQLCLQGYQDATRFLIAENHIKCGQCQNPRDTNSDCALCSAIKEEAATKTLPQEIKDVFIEAQATKKTDAGWGEGFLRMYARGVIGVFKFVVHGYVVPFKIVRQTVTVIASSKISRPSIEICPFADIC